ncbi:heptaprenylglyceryl phosphate synthase [Sporosarcina pasteurii]|uniref:Heptaprenylglyceryl phosphate synthase n=1 Tax=Sporosarcina pasteurii TaxID=1474 RepID=A0A380CBP9_SPOPA|nr:heptaprenylglyceryl phosphate synthase [Sporosarcina pasteurii]MDS9473145.1 heptaprenylglyceryl phosphate synthase [Sporosarcina pasteurii]QBQ04211.1 heptaprenylglyceryl phosphate synthase [Sporosarcina pasteurii]SUJ17354.1 Heptaprenylglyceryl phosphate synthase [Sporosarcina pasteurii]
MDYTKWRHAFKLDPAKEISDEDLEQIAESGTDGIIVGGTDEVTLDGVLDLLVRVRRFSVPLALEVSTVESVTPGFDYYFIPTVLNATETKWINGLHHAALKEYGHMMNWEEIIVEGYCILNPDCKAAKVTKAKPITDEEDLVAYAQMAEHLFKLPVFYMEYSGTYGDVDMVRAAADMLDQTKLFYGGGIKNTQDAKEMAELADTVIVGNIIYEDLKVALSTVKAVKSVVRSEHLDVQ